MKSNKFIPSTCILTETEMIQQIRNYATDIFTEPYQVYQEELSISLTLSQQTQRNNLQNISITPRNNQQSTIRNNINQRQLYQPTIHQKPQLLFTPESIKNHQMSNRENSKSKSARLTYASKSLLYNIAQKINNTKPYQQQSDSTPKNYPKNKKYQKIKPKYFQQKPIMQGYASYVKNIYQKAKTQSIMQNDKKQKGISHQKRQLLWKSFLDKNQSWNRIRNAKIIQKKMDKSNQIIQMSKPFKPFQPKPCSAEECIKRIKRKTLDLRQKLLELSFKPKIKQIKPILNTLMKQ